MLLEMNSHRRKIPPRSPKSRSKSERYHYTAYYAQSLPSCGLLPTTVPYLSALTFRSVSIPVSYHGFFRHQDLTCGLLPNYCVSQMEAGIKTFLKITESDGKNKFYKNFLEASAHTADRLPQVADRKHLVPPHEKRLDIVKVKNEGFLSGFTNKRTPCVFFAGKLDGFFSFHCALGSADAGTTRPGFCLA